MFLKEKRLEKGKSQKEMAKAIGTDEPLYSKFENYKCLPVPVMMDKLTEALNCEVRDIYTGNEVYYRKARKKPSATTGYKLTVVLPPDAKEFLQVALKECGYKDITYWIWRCYERLQKQYEIIQKEKASSKPASHETIPYIKG